MRGQVGFTLAAILVAGCTNSSPAAQQRIGLPGPAAVPLGYHVTYRVTAPGGAVTTEQLWVHRPFESDNRSLRGATVISVVVARLGRQLVRAGDAISGVLEVAVNAAPGDVRIDAVAKQALRAGTLQAGSEMRVAGRRCRVYRSLHDLTSTGLTGVPRSTDHVDTCIDSAGVVLDVRTVTNGRSAEKRAVEVTLGVAASPPGDYATIGTRIPFENGGGRITALTDTSRPPGGAFWSLATPPPGFAHLGRFAVVPPQPRVSVGQPPTSIATAIDDVFVRGPDVIVVEQGHRPRAAMDGPPVELGALGRGRLVLSGVASSVTAQLRGSAYVEVRGTVAPSVLASVARSLRAEPPGTLVTVPEGVTDGP
ncbi:MAG: hypothetical protein H0W70_01530 [Actinobacteria bacterium]|nr:hypothetical protein [Actinomycetota bacterium]